MITKIVREERKTFFFYQNDNIKTITTIYSINYRKIISKFNTKNDKDDNILK
jgi:hypothetical protein